MERSEIVYRVAGNARMRCLPLDGAAPDPAGALMRRVCESLGVLVMLAPPMGVMLGGAYARLQLWSPDHPEQGGMVWVSEELAPARAAFALAHEIGHLMLHPGETAAFAPCDEAAVSEDADPAGLRTEDHRVEEYTPRARRELEANAFAAELLAPRAQVRGLFAADASMTALELAARFGISETLARRRLTDATLAPEPASEREPLATEPAGQMPATALLDRLDEFQRTAARLAGPALVVAGPGMGKTATLVGRAAHLVIERGVPPERVLALTFSNRAAGEMRERLVASGLPGERMPVMTIHAFAASLLREYAARAPRAPGEQPLAPDFRILDEADALLLMEDLLGELPLRYYRSYGDPTRHLGMLRGDFSRACDGLHTPAGYLALVDAMRLAPAPDGNEDGGMDATTNGKRRTAAKGGRPPRAPGTFTAEEIERARERARAYAVWQGALRRRGLVDFGGLIQRAVELLREDGAVLAEVRARYPELLVDEFQDTNVAAAELLLLVAGNAGAGLWVVGDRNQAIYRWRGASPVNLDRLTRRYPRLAVTSLRRCYRSVPEIVDLGSAMAARMGALAAPTEDSNAAGLDALRAALAPVALAPVRPATAQAAVARGEAFTNAAHERLGLATAMRRLSARGVAYRDQAALCRTRKQAAALARSLMECGVPVSRLGGFFDREEVKDILALLALAVGPDTRGLFRAGALVASLGFAAPPRRELVAAIAGLKAYGRPLPHPLTRRETLASLSGLSAETRAGLHALGEVAVALRYSSALAPRLLEFVLRPRGYAWRLVRLASTRGAGAAEAERSLAALGELVRLAQRFDVRWAREDEFRQRLERAVYRGARQRTNNAVPAMPPALADAREGDPDADAMPISIEGEGEGASEPVAYEAALPIRCFLRYLAALRASGGDIPLPTGDDDAVRILTLHASKGLEFPVVYLSGLAQGQFPSTGGGREDPSPPGFREDGAPAEKEAEERCLFYVGVTRARDTVVFTRALRYGRAGAARPSPLLGLVETAPPYRDAAPLFTDGELAAMRAEADAYTARSGGNSEEEEEEESDEEALTGQRPEPIAARVGEAKPVFALHALEQYLLCP
ncbi:MAG: UvrD-helicase domain-containing protein, partial [Ktedonobacterales bacterium]